MKNKTLKKILGLIAFMISLMLNLNTQNPPQYIKHGHLTNESQAIIPFFVIFVLPYLLSRRQGTFSANSRGGGTHFNIRGRGHGSNYSSFRSGSGNFGGFDDDNLGGGGTSGSW